MKRDVVICTDPFNQDKRERTCALEWTSYMSMAHHLRRTRISLSEFLISQKPMYSLLIDTRIEMVRVKRIKKAL